MIHVEVKPAISQPREQQEIANLWFAAVMSVHRLTFQKHPPDNEGTGERASGLRQLIAGQRAIMVGYLILVSEQPGDGAWSSSVPGSDLLMLLFIVFQSPTLAECNVVWNEICVNGWPVRGSLHGCKHSLCMDFALEEILNTFSSPKFDSWKTWDVGFSFTANWRRLGVLWRGPQYPPFTSTKITLGGWFCNVCLEPANFKRVRRHSNGKGIRVILVIACCEG